MNFALQREIYGGTPWMVDALSYSYLSNILKNSQNGVTEIPETKYNSIGLLDSKSKLINYYWQLDNKDNFDAIGVVNLDGAITLSGGASSYGMEQLSSMMLRMAQDERVKSFIILTNSGGGSSAAVQVMKDTINEVKQTKPVYALIKKGGMAASAAYGIISSATKIYSASKMNIVGSLGTMIELSGRVANSESKDGEKHVRLYATKSVSKNKAFEEALNNDNYDLLINELLDPVNENFLESIINDRPQLKSTTWDDGSTVFSKDAIGTFIDGIASFDEVVGMLEKESFSTNININPNSKKMTKEEIKSQFPQAHSEIVSEGVTQERERVASWMVYQKADPEMVANGISNGESITPSQREALMVKMNSNAVIESLKADNPAEITTPESTTEKPEEPKEDEAVTSLYSKIAKSL